MPFPAHFNLSGKGHSGGGIHAFIGNLEREPAFYRIAYRRDTDTRWKMSGRIPLSVAGVYLDKLQRAVRRGESYAFFLHDMKTHQRDTIRVRFHKHRKTMQERRETKAIEKLPTFGLF